MAKETGLGWSTLSVDDSGGTLRDIRSSVTKGFEWSITREVTEVTGVDKSAMERLHLLADMSVSFEGTFDDAANASFDVFKDLSNAREFTFAHSGQTLGVTGTPTLLFTELSHTRTDKGEFNWKTSGALANGVVPVWS